MFVHQILDGLTARWASPERFCAWDTFQRKVACQRKYIKILWETSGLFQNKRCLDLSEVKNGSSNRWSKAGRGSQQCHVRYVAGGLSALWCLCTTPAELSVSCLTVPWVEDVPLLCPAYWCCWVEGLHLRTDLDQSLRLMGNLVGSVIPKGILRAKSAKPTHNRAG